MGGGQFLEDVGGGGEGFAFAVAGGRGQVQVLEQDLAELLRGIEVEAFAG